MNNSICSHEQPHSLHFHIEPSGKKNMTEDRTASSCLSQFEELLQKTTLGRYKVKNAESIRSAQQQVFILTLHAVAQEKDCKDLLQEIEPSGVGNRLIDACNRSNGRLVLRIWQGGARWWNLNSNGKDACLLLANAEVAGYRLARKAFDLYYKSYQKGHPLDFPRICIPEVLLFERGGGGSNNPWAIFSYVKDMNVISEETIRVVQNWQVCDDFIHDMVKVRKEFGFDEPHPRHGRVCVEHALEYAAHLLEDAIIPMHTIFFDVENNAAKEPSLREEIRDLNTNNFRRSGIAIKYLDMVKLYQEQTCQIIAERSSDCQNQSDRMGVFIAAIEGFIEKLVLEANTVDAFPLPSVLCHLDLQPQNMILCKSKSNNITSTTVPRVASILDWEESCYADPRFELLLVCRKIVANRKQADAIWDSYSTYVNDLFHFNVGPIDPWLRLESVHNLLGFCMQGMGLLEGGRNPWEEKSDLLNKIHREMQRLQIDLGWSKDEAAGIDSSNDLRSA